MPHFLNTTDADFDSRFTQILGLKREDSPDVDAAVAAIIDDVRRRGDAAVIELTAKFDRLELSADTLAFTEAEIEAEIARVPEAEREALELAAERIRAYHVRQMPEDAQWTDPTGAELGWRWTPVSAAGLYVPGGLASYPSSVLMNALPAKVAGVGELVMVVPTPGGERNPLVLAAAALAGVDRVFCIGGAQAVGALAFGTQTVPQVDKIVGPGNAYVAAAKRRVFGVVGIDMVAGPSEILVIADGTNDPDWIAADLLAQAEHDTAAQSILMTPSRELADAVEAAVARQLTRLPRGETAGKSWADYGAIIEVASIDSALPLADRVAAEHLELAVADPEALLPRIRNAGAIFLGHHTPEAIGDYVGGSNHVLPTARSARFSSGLSVLDFMKRSSILRCSAEGLAALGPAAIALAEAEGLGAHARSVSIRMNGAD